MLDRWKDIIQSECSESNLYKMDSTSLKAILVIISIKSRDYSSSILFYYIRRELNYITASSLLFYKCFRSDWTNEAPGNPEMLRNVTMKFYDKYTILINSLLLWLCHWMS